MATVQRSGNLAAKTIRLENPAAPVKYQGVVNSLKDTFGFIERADVVKEIFFHISEVIDGKEEDNSHIQLGDDVEFIIQYNPKTCLLVENSQFSSYLYKTW